MRTTLCAHSPQSRTECSVLGVPRGPDGHFVRGLRLLGARWPTACSPCIPARACTLSGGRRTRTWSSSTRSVRAGSRGRCVASLVALRFAASRRARRRPCSTPARAVESSFRSIALAFVSAPVRAQTKWIVAGVFAVALIIGLGVGLGVGLANRDDDDGDGEPAPVEQEVEVLVVTSSSTLQGITAEEMRTEAAQTAFKASVATMAGVDSESVRPDSAPPANALPRQTHIFPSPACECGGVPARASRRGRARTRAGRQ